MKTTVLFSTFFYFISGSVTVDGVTQCYKCTTTRPSKYSNETERLCSGFDYSSRFIVDCPYSTMCTKRRFSAKFGSMIVNITERDCAQQKFVTQVFTENRWQQKITVQEPYSEGCNEIDNKGQKLTKATYCHCRGNLCNSDNLNNSMDFFVIAVIVSIVRNI